jgi:hypothetical protein
VNSLSLLPLFALPFLQLDFFKIHVTLMTDRIPGLRPGWHRITFCEQQKHFPNAQLFKQYLYNGPSLCYDQQKG